MLIVPTTMITPVYYVKWTTLIMLFLRTKGIGKKNSHFLVVYIKQWGNL